jgi:hypothetical protein
MCCWSHDVMSPCVHTCCCVVIIIIIISSIIIITHPAASNVSPSHAQRDPLSESASIRMRPSLARKVVRLQRGSLGMVPRRQPAEASHTWRHIVSFEGFEMP